MTNTNKVEYANIEIMTVFAVVINGQVEFREKNDSYSLREFEVPDDIDTETKLGQYLDKLLEKAPYNIGKISYLYASDLPGDEFYVTSQETGE